MNLLSLIIIIILTIVSIIFVKKQFNKSNSYVEKVLYIIWIIIFLSPLILYYLDRYNVPTLLKFNKNLSVDLWFNFLGNYLGNIIGVFVSCTVLLLITFKQFEVQENKNIELKRNENIPIIKYDVLLKKTNEFKEFLIFKESGKGDNYSLFLNIENFGFNHARNFAFKVSVDGIKNTKNFRLDDVQSILKKNESKLLKLDMILDDKGKALVKNIDIDVVYQDLIGNEYVQKLNLVIEIITMEN
ncbi:hypothetical protein EOM09_06715, partial [bacterium]|nr:hypothetical protein [bacterium]